MQRLGTVALGNMGGGSFGPGKFDASDLIRPLRFHTDCRCWIPAADFHPARF
jgi:hypothetical protein